MNYGFVWPFCNWQNAGTVQTCKYNTCIAFYYKCSCSNYRQLQPSDYTPTPSPQPMPPKIILRSPKSTAYIATFLNTLHWNQGRSRVLAPNALESGSGLGKAYFTFDGNFFLLVTEFSALKPKILCYQEVWSLFVCLLFFLPLPVHSKSCFPLSDPFLKLDPRLCSPLLRHCICIMYSKHWIGRKAVELLEN